jgi:hypothetical protein
VKRVKGSRRDNKASEWMEGGVVTLELGHPRPPADRAHLSGFCAFRLDMSELSSSVRQAVATVIRMNDSM